jgi:hypothetical protein
MIKFVPIAKGGSESGARIINGRYVIPRSHGLTPGTYKVRIYSGASNPQPEEAGDPGTPTKEPIPAKYNEATTLEIDVRRNGPFTFDFLDLEDK